MALPYHVLMTLYYLQEMAPAAEGGALGALIQGPPFSVVKIVVMGGGHGEQIDLAWLDSMVAP